jgi:hypothetical protein
MKMVRISFEVPEAMVLALQSAAGMQDSSVGTILRAAVKAELRRCAARAKSPARVDEQHLVHLRAVFAPEFAAARNWTELADSLWLKGAALREAGGGLALYERTSGARICKASDIGCSLQVLARRFRAPFPGERSGFRFGPTETTAPNETDIII